MRLFQNYQRGLNKILMAAVGILFVVPIGCATDEEKVEIERTLSKQITVTNGGLNGVAQNPIVSHSFNADPSAKVFDGRIYVYASHDLDDQSSYSMTDYHVYSSDDLVNWQDHGVVLDVKDIGWAMTLYAPDAAYSPVTGKYYLYFPNGANNIGVAVSDTPYGPFEDALGQPLVSRDTPGVSDVEWVFDPMCFVDDDGQAYLYFGGGMPNTGDNARVIRLNDDMISLKDEAATVIEAPDFFEAAFVNKYNGKYYFSYSTTFSNHAAYIDYMVSDNPMTGWEYRGTVLKNPSQNKNNNNHQSIVEYEGNWYIFYHNRIISSRDGLSVYQRSITLDHLFFQANGDIREVPTKMGVVKQRRHPDAYSVLQAEAMASQSGIETGAVDSVGATTAAGVMVTDIHNEDWIGYSRVAFGTDGATTFTARVASGAAEAAIIDVYIDGCDMFSNLPGRRIGECVVHPTGGWQQWKDISCHIDAVSNTHDVYLRFVGNGEEPLFNLDYFSFE